MGPRRPLTICAFDGDERLRYHGAVSPPIFQTSTFVFDSPEAAAAAMDGEGEGYIYSRDANPTVAAAEKRIAALEGGEAARLFASGMAAISAAVMSHVQAGDHIVCPRSAYGPTLRLLHDYLPRYGVETTFIDGADPAEWAAATRPTTRLYYLESPSSLLFQVQDLAAVAGLARERGIATIIDNSWASPIYQQPLTLGVDVVVHTATKYLGGHSDVLAGAAVGSGARMARLRQTERALLGGSLAPLDAWLLLRGLRTLPLRMAQHQEAGLELARMLEQHPRVARVIHPGLPSHPQHALHLRQAGGCGSLFAVELAADPAGVRRFLTALRIFGLGVSWGGYESLVWYPRLSAHRPAPAPEPPAGLVRLYAGLEDPADLAADLEQALAAL